jgi:hypothetical protein
MMAKIPIVIPRRDRKVLSLFAFKELYDNEKLSNISLIKSIGYFYL